MSGMDGMAMPGGWTMSMLWMRMPGQSWLDLALAFIGMWSVMMAVMMLPSLLPMLRRYRRSVGGVNAARLTGAIALGTGAWLMAVATA
jgi:predicted metal-binding membrane protein